MSTSVVRAGRAAVRTAASAPGFHSMAAPDRRPQGSPKAGPRRGLQSPANTYAAPTRVYQHSRIGQLSIAADPGADSVGAAGGAPRAGSRIPKCRVGRSARNTFRVSNHPLLTLLAHHGGRR